MSIDGPRYFADNFDFDISLLLFNHDKIFGGEGAATALTAMTSPHTAPAEVVAAVATAGSNDTSDRDLQHVDNPANNSAVAVASSNISHDAIPYGIRDMNLFDPNGLLPQDQGALPVLNPAFEFEAAPDLRPAPVEGIVQAYAKLVFSDGFYFINTHQFILGRDMKAAKAALRREADEKKNADRIAAGQMPRTPKIGKGQDSKYSKSAISESGGIIRGGHGSDSDSDQQKEKKIKKSESSGGSRGSSSQRRDSLIPPPNSKFEYSPQVDSSAQVYVPDSAAAKPVNPAILQPSPHDCPVIGLHPPVNLPASQYKAISRQHIKIAFNQKRNEWEAKIMGRNGAFVDDVYHFHGDVTPLRHRSIIQIGPVSIEFLLPDTPAEDPDADLLSADGMSEDDWVRGPNGWTSPEGKCMTPVDRLRANPSKGKKLRAKFERPYNEESSTDADEDDRELRSEVSGDDQLLYDEDPYGENKEIIGEEDEEEEEEDDEERRDEEDFPLDEDDEEQAEAEEVVKEEIPLLIPKERKRGPGRPPKNGHMSKREERELKKQREAQEKAKKSGPQPSVPKKGPGRPKKNPTAEIPEKREKRPYKKRAPKGPDTVKREGSNDDDKPNDKKDNKPPKKARSPTPTFDEALLTPEQLAKPNANYVELIAEALAASPEGKMSLPQIYRAIQRKYPFFVLRTTTHGWQSSVRHNLSQHPAFEKLDREGKGYLWGLVAGIPIGKDKKQRQRTPPPPGQYAPQTIYAAHQHGMPPGMIPGQPGMMAPPPGYAANGPMPPHYMSGQHPQHPQYRGPQPPSGYGPAIGQQPGFPGPIPPTSQPPAPNGSTYRSPYNPNPATIPPPANAHHQYQQAPPPPMPPHPVQSNLQPQGLPMMSPVIRRAVDNFRETIISGYPNPNAGVIVASAINRVLGHDPDRSILGSEADIEQKLTQSLSATIEKIAGGPEFLRLVQQHRAHPPPPLTQNRPLPSPQANISVQRPRPNGVPISVPRPSMTHGVARTHSGTPASRPGGSSSSPVPTTTAANALPSGNTASRLSESGATPLSPSLVSDPAPPKPDPTPRIIDESVASLNPSDGQQSSSAMLPDTASVSAPANLPANNVPNSSSKRQRSEDEESVAQPDFKRQRSEEPATDSDFKPLESSGPATLKA
jgi:hypothetical protein